MDPGSCDGKTSNTIGYGNADCAGATYSKAATGRAVQLDPKKPMLNAP
jgi:hypothetical protein